MLQLAVTTHMEVANKVVFVGSSLWHWVHTTRVQTNLRGPQAPAPFHTRRCTSYEGLDRGLRRFPWQISVPLWRCLGCSQASSSRRKLIIPTLSVCGETLLKRDVHLLDQVRLRS